MRAALSTGANFWNGGELYGTATRNSLHLLHEYFSTYPEDADKVVLSIKGGMIPGTLTPDGGETNVRRSVDECVRILDGKKKIDVFECSRVDPKVPIEDTIKVLRELVQEGKIGGIGLSEVDADSIRRAAQVFPIAAVEVELSLWTTDVLRNRVASTCRELNVPVVAYSPLMRGALVGQFTSNAEIPEGDFRKSLPKFQDDVLAANLKLTQEVEKLAHKKGVTQAQVAIGWVKSLSRRKRMPVIVPIPGATTTARALENGRAVEMTEEEMQELQRILDENVIVGERYPSM